MAGRDDDPTAHGARPLSRASGGGRVVRLRKQHRELQAKVRRKRRALERLRDEASAVTRAVAERAATVRAEQHDDDEQLHAAFDAIERNPRLARSDRQAVRQLYRWLQSIGAISELAPDLRDDRDGAEVARPDDRRDAVAMRPTFLRLAAAYHPDKTTDAELIDRHTEIMKQLNRAYADGDVSRLLELERALDDRADVTAALDPSTLETQVAALRAQLRDLSRQTTDLRGAYEGAVALEHRRLAAAGHPDPVSAIVDDLRRAADETRSLRDLVHQFRDGHIDLHDLLAGPAPPPDGVSWLTEMFARR